MIATALLIVCLSPLTTVPPAEGLATPPQRAAEAHQEWLAPLGSLRRATVTRVGTAGDLLLAEDSLGGLTALDPATGQARWFVQLPAPLSAWPVPGDTRIALACTPDVLVVASATGSRRFMTSASTVPCNSPAADAHAVYVPTLLGNRVVATAIGTGQVAWSYQMAAPITTPAQLIGPAGTRSVLIGCDDGMLRALPTGLAVPERERWIAHVGRVIDRPVVAGDRILVANSDRVLQALDAASGTTIWRHLPGEPLRSAPVAVGDIVVCATDTRLVGLHAANGQLAWEQAVAAKPLGDLNGALLAARADGSTELRDAATGAVLMQGLPADAVSCGGLLVELRGRSEVVAWKLVR